VNDENSVKDSSNDIVFSLQVLLVTLLNTRESQFN